MATDGTLPELVQTLLPQLIKQFDSSTLSELELRLGELRVTLRRSLQAQVTGATPMPPAAMSPGAAAEPEPPQGFTVTAQMVGTFYLTSAPGKPPLVQEGDLVEEGQVIGIIEAMKVMNEIESEVSGRVARLLVKNQTPVEYGQPLMIIVPE
ncbi:MAG: acetyl-CoA carboxylase, biotin carboxyl carrier protein [Chloroflexi bacterium]|nr:acetyl-CoA carboxylase, biotin carboxyl carrier protein [Chloroflexota bacterium]